jgi:lactate dehydrogenase-like 2-hydroxyacid dehydrogenase
MLYFETLCPAREVVHNKGPMALPLSAKILGKTMVVLGYGDIGQTEAKRA